MFKRILIATHGTEGAKKAESYAIKLAGVLGAELHGLYVIHKGWGSLVGIEWLHSSEKRMEFYRYAESELYRMADVALTGFVQRAEAHGLNVKSSVRVGDPGDVIAEEAGALGADIVIIGSSNNNVRSEEYKARISLKRLMKLAPCPVLVVNNKLELMGKGGERRLTEGVLS